MRAAAACSRRAGFSRDGMPRSRRAVFVLLPFLQRKQHARRRKEACPRATGRLWLSAADLLSIAHRRSQSGRVWATLANISPEHTPSLPESRIRLPQTERDCWRIAGARPEMRPIDRGAGRRRKPASHLATFRANQMSGRTSSKRGRPSAAVLTLIHFPFSLSH